MNKSQPEALLRVLYDPLSYYRPWRHAVGTLSARQRGTLNAWLIERHALPACHASLEALPRLGRRMIEGWPRLPCVAYLMACAKHRRLILARRDFLAYPSAVHAFLRLRFDECPPVAAASPDGEALLGWGAAYLCEGLASHLPDWLHARLRLSFAGLTRPLPTPRADTAVLDMACFWSAWNYAANDTGQLAAICR